MKHKKFFLAIIAVIMIISMGGCGGSNDSKEKVITMPFTKEASVVNPVLNQVEKMSIIGNLLYDPLFVYSGEIQNYLANSVENKDNKEFIIELRKGLKWHDGVDITAEDVEFTLKLILDKLQGSPLRQYLLIDKEPVAFEIIDPLKIKITLPKEKADFIHNLSRIAPIPKHIYEGEPNIAASKKNELPVGSGPFKFVELQERESLTLEKFDYYYGGKPKIDKIIIKSFEGEKEKEEALIEGTLTLMKVAPEMAQKYKNDKRFDIYPYNTGRVNYILFNQNSEKMKALNIRKAIAHSLNRKELMAEVYGEDNQVSGANSIFTPGADFYSDESVEGYDYNVEEAKNLINKSQIELKKIVIGYNIEEPIHKKYAKKAKEQLEALGIEVELKEYDGLTFLQTLFSESNICDLYINGYTLGINPNNYRAFFETNSYYNKTGYSNLKVDELWKKGFEETDNEKRKNIYRDIQAMIMEDYPLYLIDYEAGFLITQNSLKGVDNARPAPIILFEDWSRLSIKE